MTKDFTDVRPICEVCGKHRAHGDHERCSKLRRSSATPVKRSITKAEDDARKRSYLSDRNYKFLKEK